MQNFEQLGRELEKRGKTESIRKLAESSDGAKLAGMVDASALENAARSGDSEAIRLMLSKVLSTQEGKRLAENVRRLMQE